MGLTTAYSINQIANTAVIDLYVDSILVTTYSFDGATDTVTLSAISPPAITDKTTIEHNFIAVDTWYAAILKFLDGSVVAPADHDCNLKDGATEADIKIKLDGNPAIQLTLQKSTGIITVHARPSIIVGIRSFGRYVNFLGQFISLTRQ
jgi:hypothetical protein